MASGYALLGGQPYNLINMHRALAIQLTEKPAAGLRL
jgi:hypothetical protein